MLNSDSIALNEIPRLQSANRGQKDGNTLVNCDQIDSLG